MSTARNIRKKKNKTESFLNELDINPAQIMRTIEHLKAIGEEVNPGSIALKLGIPRAFLYSDLDLLSDIYRYCPRPIGPDQAIQTLMSEIKSKERKIKKHEKKICELEEAVEKNFSDGFAKGAAMNYKPLEESLEATANEKKPNDFMDFLKKERELKAAWAKGVLCLDPQQEQSQEEIKRAYRKLVQLMHPDKSGDNEIIQVINDAYNLLS